MASTGGRSADDYKRRKKRRRRRRRGGPRWFFWVIPLFLIIAAAGFFVFRTYALVGGRLVPRDAETLDLRSERISAETYRELTDTFPDAEILWSVPLGNRSFDCTSSSVSISSWSDSVLQNLAYFRDLRYIDASEAALTEEQYLALRAAAPDCVILWSVPIGGTSYRSDSESIVLNALSADDIPLFGYLPALREADARAVADYASIAELKRSYPELSVLWQITLSGASYTEGATELLVSDSATTVEDVAVALSLLPDVRSVSVPESSWTDEEKLALAAEYPDVIFSWPVSLRGQTLSSGQEELSFAGIALTQADITEMKEKLRFFPSLKTVDLTGCGLGTEEIAPLCDAYPELDVYWDFDLLGIPVSTKDETIDLSNITMADTSALEAVLPYMHHLTKVDMCDCGLSDQVMDDLNQRWDPIRFVWMLHITTYHIRTDTTFFRATSSHYGTFTNESVQRLGYCEDMVVLDLGHRPIGDLSFVSRLQKLRFACLLDCAAQDLSPLAECPELVWLELNRAQAHSIAPLAGSKSLRHLNITFMSLYSQEETYNTLKEMTWLERVWFSRPLLTEAQEQQLKSQNPETMYHVVFVWEQSNENPWRFHELYYEMRDIMNMFYMDGTGAIDYKVIDGVRYDLDPEFLAGQDHGEHDRDHG